MNITEEELILKCISTLIVFATFFKYLDSWLSIESKLTLVIQLVVVVQQNSLSL